MGFADILAVGAVAALGANALQLTLCIRAGMFQPRSLGHRDRRGRRVGMCLAGGLGERLSGPERLLALGANALGQAAAGVSLDGWPLLVALPESGRPDDDARLAGPLLHELARTAPFTADRAASAVVRSGHAGFAQALVQALELIDQGAAGVVVGGIDSYFDPRVLRALEDEHRLHTLDAADGFVPGEAAAFVLLSQPGHADAQARLLGAAYGHEPAAAEGETNVAATMTRLVADCGGTRAPWLMTDVNGERYRVREWSLVSVRHGLALESALRLPDHCGDVGAASGALMAALAVNSWRLGCAPADSALLMLHSEATARGVVRLGKVPG